ncbi:MAG: DUF2059 domain-containing protein [Erythrobacter sp.]|nr:DUF2059 domain-containing protein [Erythrobacter sp.]
MIMRSLTAAAAGLALLVATPALAAQDATPTAPSEADQLAAMSEMFSGMFTAEPLTPDQESRLPAAEQLIAKVIPEGTMAEMMDKVYNGVMGPIMAAAPDGATTTLARQIGLPPYALDLGEDQAAELASLFDPAWAERQQREMAIIPAMMKDVMTLMEPGMRKAMAELYAIRFSDSDLAEIDAFFSTTTGAKYARESFLMASDPRIMAASMDAMPALMGMMGDMEARMAESVADLPAVRSFADLSPEERARVAEMTGYSVEDIEANLNRDEGDSDFE